MEIRDLEFALVEIPRLRAATPSGGVLGGGGSVRSLLVCLTADDGEEGWGEAPLPWRLSELVERRRALLPALVGRSVYATEELLGLKCCFDRPLAAALEMACWDLIGRRMRLPLYQLLGGAYRQHLPLAVRLPACDDESLQRVARDWADSGYHQQILTAAGEVDRDVATLAALNRTLADRAELHLDAAGKFVPDEARALIRQVESFAPRALIDLFVRAGNAPPWHALAAAARQTSTPLWTHRAVDSPAACFAALRTGAAKRVVVDLFRVGGLSTARRCAAVAAAAGATASLAAENAVGPALAAMLHLAAAAPDFSGGNLCTLPELADQPLAGPLDPEDGMPCPPQGAGLGVEIDRDKLEHYQAR